MTLELFMNGSLIFIANALCLYLIYVLIGFMRLRKQKQAFAPLHDQLKVGQTVMLSSGLYGKIKNISDEVVQLEIADKVVVRISRFSIHSIIEV